MAETSPWGPFEPSSAETASFCLSLLLVQVFISQQVPPS